MMLTRDAACLLILLVQILAGKCEDDVIEIGSNSIVQASDVEKYTSQPRDVSTSSGDMKSIEVSMEIEPILAPMEPEPIKASGIPVQNSIKSPASIQAPRESKSNKKSTGPNKISADVSKTLVALRMKKPLPSFRPPVSAVGPHPKTSTIGPNRAKQAFQIPPQYPPTPSVRPYEQYQQPPEPTVEPFEPSQYPIIKPLELPAEPYDQSQFPTTKPSEIPAGAYEPQQNTPIKLPELPVNSNEPQQYSSRIDLKAPVESYEPQQYPEVQSYEAPVLPVEQNNKYPINPPPPAYQYPSNLPVNYNTPIYPTPLPEVQPYVPQVKPCQPRIRVVPSPPQQPDIRVHPSRDNYPVSISCPSHGPQRIDVRAGYAARPQINVEPARQPAPVSVTCPSQRPQQIDIRPAVQPRPIVDVSRPAQPAPVDVTCPSYAPQRINVRPGEISRPQIDIGRPEVPAPIEVTCPSQGPQRINLITKSYKPEIEISPAPQPPPVQVQCPSLGSQRISVRAGVIPKPNIKIGRPSELSDIKITCPPVMSKIFVKPQSPPKPEIRIEPNNFAPSPIEIDVPPYEPQIIEVQPDQNENSTPEIFLVAPDGTEVANCDSQNQQQGKSFENNVVDTQFDSRSFVSTGGEDVDFSTSFTRSDTEISQESPRTRNPSLPASSLNKKPVLVADLIFKEAARWNKPQSGSEVIVLQPTVRVTNLGSGDVNIILGEAARGARRSFFPRPLCPLPSFLTRPPPFFGPAGDFL